MKAADIKSWVKSPRVQKWGLFGLLAITLGFNLSMNPEHFNNIARYPKFEALNEYQMAQVAAEAKPKIEVDTSKTQSYELETASGKRFKVSAYQLEIDGKTSTQAQIKELCKCDTPRSEVLVLSHTLSDVDQWKDELRKKLAEKEDQSSSDEAKTDTTKKIGKKDKPEFTPEQMKEAALRCKKVAKEDRLDCHSTVLVNLSKKLDDSRDSDRILAKYFTSYLAGSLTELFSKPTIDSFTLQPDYSGLNTAEEICRKLLEDLNPDNSQSIVQMMTKLKAGSYSAQARNALDLFAHAKMEQESPYTFAHGMQLEQIARNSLDPRSLGFLLRQDMINWRGALDSGEKSHFASFLLNRHFQMPVSNMINNLGNLDFKAFNTTGTDRTQWAQAIQNARMAIPDLGLGFDSGYGGMGAPFLNAPGQIYNSDFPGRTFRGGNVNPLFVQNFGTSGPVYANSAFNNTLNTSGIQPQSQVCGTYSNVTPNQFSQPHCGQFSSNPTTSGRVGRR